MGLLFEEALGHMAEACKIMEILVKVNAGMLFSFNTRTWRSH